MRVLQRRLVFAMDAACAHLDQIPWWQHDDDTGWYRVHGHFGCGLLRLGSRAAQLDERWRCGLYEDTR